MMLVILKQRQLVLAVLNCERQLLLLIWRNPYYSAKRIRAKLKTVVK